jgi:hypothetical protein
MYFKFKSLIFQYVQAMGNKLDQNKMSFDIYGLLRISKHDVAMLMSLVQNQVCEGCEIMKNQICSHAEKQFFYNIK